VKQAPSCLHAGSSRASSNSQRIHYLKHFSLMLTFAASLLLYQDLIKMECQVRLHAVRASKYRGVHKLLPTSVGDCNAML
jgi:hypothetical protein